MNFQDVYLDIKEFLLYGIFRLPPPVMPKIDPSTTFRLVKEKGGYWIQSASHPGLVASGKTYQELREACFDAVLTYFDVPRYHAKRMRDSLVLNLEDGRQIQPPQPVFQMRVVNA